MQHHDPQVFGRDAGAAQRHEFRDRVVLTVAAAAGERRERGRPDVDPAMLGEVAHRPDGEIDRAIDFAEPGAAVAEPRGVDDIEELQCGRRHAALTVALAQGKLHHFVVEAALHAEPFVAQSAGVREDAASPNGSAERAINSIEADSTGVSARESAEPNHATPHATTPARQARENTDKTI